MVLPHALGGPPFSYLQILSGRSGTVMKARDEKVAKYGCAFVHVRK